MMARRRCFALLLTTAFAVAAADSDLILHNGKIATLDPHNNFAQAISFKNGRISDIGTSAAVLRSERGSATKLIDLQGKTVLPGLADAHVHALEAGLSEWR